MSIVLLYITKTGCLWNHPR